MVLFHDMCQTLTCSVSLVHRINMSQQPDTLRLQQRLYQQLNNKDSTAKLSTSIEQQAEALKTAAAGKVVLVVLDGKRFLSWRNYA